MFVNWLLAIVPQLQPVGNKSLLMLLRPCELPCLLHSNGTWTSFQTKVPRTGSSRSQWPGMASPCQNQPSVLPSACAKLAARPSPLSLRLRTGISIDHALSCATGWYSVLRQSKLRNFTTSVMQEVCHDLAFEPPLQPLDGEQLPSNANVTKEGRLDISTLGFWGDRFSRSLFDVRVFQPNPPSAITTSLASQHPKHEPSNKCQYKQRVREVEGASFVPLVFSTAGGMGACLYSRLQLRWFPRHRSAVYFRVVSRCLRPS